ncbi:LolA family protein [Psittacicella gerlachiana]|uniref:Outer membrane lipoprotein carrier protein LolA n=1 Tax=Psittacicella gerlachiana TaxID=2028574 RepID=A0A3A1YH88_9GAMM|nr:outer membrane lipoprotein carrier protein LolA [Psittacicella gerlachiana]RIY36826.1 hypothetical protein CKF59_02105 [Psittacicella gerlachiana]
MKKYFISIFLLCFASFSWAFSQSQLINQLQQPESLQGNFKQERYLQSIPLPITSTGEFTLVKAKGLLWQMQTPFAVNLRLNQQGISQWNGQAWINSNQLVQAAQIKLFLGLLSGDLSGIESQFQLQLQGTAQNWQLELIPQSLLMKQIFTSIFIQGGNLIQKITLNETQGDRTVITFSQIQVDQPLTAFAQDAFAE